MSECCCTNTLDLGCFDCDSTVIIGEATQTGRHIIRIYDPSGANQKIKETVTSGADIELTFDAETMDMGVYYTLTVENPDGTDYTVTVDSVEYDCFSLLFDRILWNS